MEQSFHHGLLLLMIIMKCTYKLLSFAPQVWALAVGRKTEMLATGGTDAILNLWHDCTMEDKQEDFRKKARETLHYCTFCIASKMLAFCLTFAGKKK